MQKSLFDMMGGSKKDTSKKDKLASSNSKLVTKSKQTSEEIEIKTENSKSKKMEIPEEIKALITWKDTAPVPYSFLVSMCLLLEKEPGRLAKIDILTKHFLAVISTTPNDLIPLVFILTGELRPSHEGVKLVIGQSLIIQGIVQATGRTKEDIQNELRTIGDLGLIAMKSKKGQNSLDSMMGVQKESLTIRSVYKQLLDIAKVEGNNAQRHKTGGITKLLTLTKGDEAKFIIRSFECNLGIGCAESTFLLAIGKCFRLRETYLGISKQPDDDELTAKGKLFKANFLRYPLIDKLIEKMIEGGFDLIEKDCGITVGVPIRPMLAKPAKSTAEVKNRMGDCAITSEYKYDGERAQIHKTKKGDITVFSRNSKDSTKQFEEIKPLILTQVEGEDFILDSEIVAFDVEKGIILPFQTLMHRPRKGNAKNEPSPIQVCAFVFDILFLNGESLKQKPFRERRATLHRVLKPVEHRLQTANFFDSDLDNLKDFFEEAIAHRTEGLMVKALDSEYEPGHRSQFWAKLKKDYVKGLGTAEESSASDTVDVVVVGASYGKGKRGGLYGVYLVAVWNEDNGKYQTICEVGTGFSDQNLKDFHETMQDHICEKPPREVQYSKNNKVDVYIKPFIVWEIGVADITVSPTSMACFGDVKPDSGISLRFGRFMKIREDKDPTQCTNTHQILDMYYAQPNIADSD